MANLVQVIKKRVPLDGETSAVNPSYAKAVNDAIAGAVTVEISTVRAGNYLIATVFTA
jgi:hypothetical protein